MTIRALCLGLLIAFTSGATSQSVTRAQSATRSGDYERMIHTALAEFDAGNFAEAHALFEQAHAIRPSARTLRGMGVTSFELKHYVQARGDLQASLTDSRQPLTEVQRRDVQVLLDRVGHYVGRVELHVEPADATVMLNGKRVSEPVLELDLGDYEFTASARGYRDARVQLTVEGGETQKLTLQLVELFQGAGASRRPLELRPPVVAVPAARSDATTAPIDAAPAEGGLLTRWWFWTAVGVVVAGGVVTAVALTADAPQKPLEQGEIGGVVMTLGGGR